MKPLQLLAVLGTLIVCIAVLAWLAQRLPRLESELEPSIENPVVAEPSETPEEDPDKEYFPTNPFTPATGESLPHAELPEKEYEFGRMGLGQTGKHDFVVRNTGNSPLKLARGPIQCKCTVSGLKEREIPAGGEATIHLAWEPKSLGPFSQSATFWTNDPENPELKVIVSGEMFAEIDVQPVNGWVLGNLSTSKPTTLNGYIRSAVFEKFKVTKVETSSDRVTMKAVPMTEAELKEADVRFGFNLQGELAGISEPGKVSEQVTIHTDLEDYPEFELPITANRIGAITIIGPHWFAGGPMLDLGKVDSEKGKKIKLTVMIPPSDKELKLTAVQSDPGFVKLELKPEKLGKDLSRERYSLYVEVPPGSPQGIWGPGRMGKIIVKTNHKQVQEMDIELKVEVD